MAMVSRFAAIAVLCLAALFPGPVRADLVSPEPGAWWNPATSGTGVQIEVQDNLITLTYFGYNAQGQPVFYLLAGAWDAENKRFAADVNAFSNGTCLGCPFRQPQVTTLGRGGAVFSSRTRGVLTLPRGGGTTIDIPIERVSFAFGGSPEFRQLGLWATTIAFSTGSAEGDMVVIDEIDQDASGPFVKGRLFPEGSRIVGETLSVPGSSINYFWAVAVNAELFGYYVGEISLNGIVGAYQLALRTAPIPITGGTPVYGTRVAGPTSFPRFVTSNPTGSPASTASATGKRRALLAEGSATRSFTEAEVAALAPVAERLRQRLERELEAAR
jgi:hypothetical protein